MEEVRPFSPAALSFAVLAIAAGIVVPSGFPRWTIFIAIVASCMYMSKTSTETIHDYPLAIFYTCIVFTASDYIVFSNPQRDFRQAGQTVSIESASLAVRTKWGFRLWSSIRGVGWEHEPDVFLPAPPPSTSRTSFISKRVSSMIMYALLGDVASIYNQQCPTFLQDGISFSDRQWIWRPVDMFFWLLATTSTIRMLHAGASTVSVLLHLSRPENWKPPLGHWSDAYSLRRFWGRVWQQFMRRFFSVHGKFVARHVLHLQPGTNASSYVQLYTAFILSGLMHWSGDHALNIGWRMSGTMPFFFLQAVAITAEDGVASVANRMGFKGRPGVGIRVIGYAWVIGWFALTLPIWWDPMNRRGFMGLVNMKESVVQAAWNSELWLR